MLTRFLASSIAVQLNSEMVFFLFMYVYEISNNRNTLRNELETNYTTKVEIIINL